jgi:transcriptional regulator with XRE-family HTH domain
MAEGQTLASLRSIAGLSQGEVADRLGISVPSVSETEHRDYVRPDTAARYQEAVLSVVREKTIAQVLGNYVKDLLGEAAERDLLLLRETA